MALKTDEHGAKPQSPKGSHISARGEAPGREARNTDGCRVRRPHPEALPWDEFLEPFRLLSARHWQIPARWGQCTGVGGEPLLD